MNKNCQFCVHYYTEKDYFKDNYIIVDRCNKEIQKRLCFETRFAKECKCYKEVQK